MPTIKLDWDHLIVEINRPGAPPEYVFKKRLSTAAMLSFAREDRFARQCIRMEIPKGISEGNSTVVGLQVAAELAEKFSKLDPKAWQNHVHLYELYNTEQLKDVVEDLFADIRMLDHTEALPEVNRALAYLQRYYPVERTRMREGELSGDNAPLGQRVPTKPMDANGQCPPGWIYSSRLGGCIELPENAKASSDLRKPRGMTERPQFSPEGVDTVLGSTPGHDNSGEPNLAMGNVQGLSRMQEGELSGDNAPLGQILQGVDPDSKGQCPRGTIFSARVGKCIQLSIDQQADALRGNRTQHIPEGTDVVMGSQAGPDNSGEPNPAMGFHGPLATLEGEGWTSLSNRYAYCMSMLKKADYTYYASMHASERFCFLPFEGVNDGYINAFNTMVHAHPFNLTAKTEEFLDAWRQTEEKDFNEKTDMDTAYQRDIEQRLRYRKTLVEFIRHGRTDEQIRRALEQTQLSREAVHSLMVDVSMLRRITPSKPRPRIIIQMDSETAASSKPLTRKEQVDQVEDAANKRRAD